MDTVERRGGTFDSLDFDVKKSRFERNELLLTGGFVDCSDLVVSCWDRGGNKAETSSGRPHFFLCCLKASSFSLVSRISRAINDSE